MNYCEHFAKLVPWKLPPITKSICSQCKNAEPFLWMCLTKGCGVMVCDRGNHRAQHSQQFKQQHFVFVNITSAEIRCLLCKIQIYDLEHVDQQQLKRYPKHPDPMAFRQRFIKNSEVKMLYGTGHLENSQAHKKSNRGLCSLTDRPQNSAINSAVMFISHVPYLRKIIKNFIINTIKNQSISLFSELVTLVRRIWSGQSKTLPMNELMKALYEKFPNYKGYGKKDAFEVVIILLNCMHEQLKYFKVKGDNDGGYDHIPDDWQIIRKLEENKQSVLELSPIKSALEGELVYYLSCQCKQTKVIKGSLLRLQLEVPKVRKKCKEIEEEMGKRGCDSPFGKRRRSLFDRILGIEDEYPLTLAQLLLEFMSNRPPADKTKIQCTCSKAMKMRKSQFTKLPPLLIVKVDRSGKAGQQINMQSLDCPDSLDMNGFVVEGYSGPTTYELASTICYSSEREFVAVVRHCKNKQRYEFRNGSTKIYTDKLPIYMASYTLKNSNTSLYHNIKSNMKLQIKPQCLLPDFWLEKLKYFNPGELDHPAICKHGKLKSNVNPRSTYTSRIPAEIYRALLEKFGGKEYLPIDRCEHCLKEYYGIQYRKKREKQIVTQLDSYKCKGFCMVAYDWINRWTVYLYKRKDYNYYLVKGVPPPGPITNNLLLESSSKCKANLRKNIDYKIVNYYVWAFFKEMYGGGPQIQYRSKEQKAKVNFTADPEVLKDVSQYVKQLRGYTSQQYYLNREWEEFSPSSKQSKISSDHLFKTSSKESD